MIVTIHFLHYSFTFNSIGIMNYSRNRRFNAFFSLFSPFADKHAEQRVVHEAGLGEYFRDERLVSVKNF